MKFGDNSLSSQYISANYCRNIHAIYLLWFADVFGGGVRGRGGGGTTKLIGHIFLFSVQNWEHND